MGWGGVDVVGGAARMCHNFYSREDSYITPMPMTACRGGRVRVGPKKALTMHAL